MGPNNKESHERAKPDAEHKDKQLNDLEAQLVDVQSKRSDISKKIGILRGSKTTRKNEIRAQLHDIRLKRQSTVELKDKLILELEQNVTLLKEIRQIDLHTKEGMRTPKGKNLAMAIQELQIKETTENISEEDQQELKKERAALEQLQNDMELKQGEKLKLENDRTRIKSDLENVRKELEIVGVNVSKLHSELVELNLSAEGQQEELRALMEERDEYNTIIEGILKEKRSIIAQWEKEIDHYYEETVQLQKEKEQKDKESQERKLKEIEKRRQIWEAEEAKKKPWLEEIALCDFLINYLQNIERTSPNNSESQDSSADQLSNNINSDANCQEPEATKETCTLVHSLDVITSFELLSLVAPTCGTTISNSIRELVEKRDYFDALPHKMNIEPPKPPETQREGVRIEK